MTADRTPGLSVCCLSGDDPNRLARIVSTVRDVADEVIVGVDSRVDPHLLGPLLDVCDSVSRFEFADPVEQARPWIVEQCSRSWVLMIDDDEAPSRALLEALPSLIADETAVQCRLARRWCFPDVDHYLAERPWSPDYQRRLFRHGPDLDFDLSVHGGVRAALPARYVDQPIYHLACVLRGFAERRRRVREYERIRPGLVAVGGGPMNDTLYVPEHFATLRPLPTPDEDVDRLRFIVDSGQPDVPRRGTPPDIPIVSAEEIATSAPADGLAAHGYRASLRIVEADLRTEPGNDTLVSVEVTNHADVPLPCEDARGVQVRLGTRLTDEASGGVDGQWALTPLPCDVPPHASRIMEALIRVPDRPGSQTLEIDLINERSRWFGCGIRDRLVVATRWGRDAR